MLRLRPYKSSDGDALVTWAPEERAFSMWCARMFQFPLTREQLDRYHAENDASGDSWSFTALDEDGVPAGHILMRLADYKEQSLRFGYIILRPDARGKGWGEEMLRLAAKYAFEILGMQKVTLGVYSCNPRAKKCYERVGFREERCDKDALQFQDESWDVVQMVLER